MPTQTEKAARFLELHRGDTPLLMPNAWDRGSARLLGSLGFAALATTSSGFAATLGLPDGSVPRDEAIGHGAWLAADTDLPVSADLENCYSDTPDGVAQTVQMAIEAGLAGCSIEDYTGRDDAPLYGKSLAAERVAAAAQIAHGGPVHLVLTARAENYLRSDPDLADTIARLQAYQEAGADVLYAPSVTSAGELREIVRSVDRPVNVLALPGVPPVAELAEMGVARISVGGAFAFAALGALAQSGRELLEHGTYGYWELARPGAKAARSAFRR